MAIASPQMLPGIRFEPQPPPPDDVLPRMDICAFAGIAARGPLDVPVAVEDLASFTAVFGSDVVLGDNRATGEELTAQLRPAVAAFFRNGGHRCWVVRVASSDALRLRFPLPGVLRVVPAVDSALAPGVGQAIVEASSVGTWAAGLSVGAALEALPLELTSAEPPQGGDPNDDRLGAAGWWMLLGGRVDLAPGDVLRIGLDPATTAYAVIASVEPRPAGQAETWVSIGAVEAFLASTPATGAQGRLRWFGDGTSEVAPASITEPVGMDGEVTITVPSELGPGPREARWARFENDEAQAWWLPVVELRSTLDGSAQSLLVTGPSFRLVPGGSVAVRDRLRQATNDGGFGAIRVERLRLSLFTGSAALRDSIPDLGLAPGHPRFVDALPTDEARLGVDPLHPDARPPSAGRGNVSPALAGIGEPGFFVPLAVGPVPLWSSPPFSLGASADPDGLLRLGPAHFVDPDLADVESPRLIAEADFLRYQSPTPRELRGIHALLGVDEVTIVSVPDAALPAWVDEDGRHPPNPDVPAQPAGIAETFEICDPGSPAAPEPRVEWTAPGATAFRIAWPRVHGADSYVIQEVVEPATWSPPEEYQRSDPALDVEDAADGTHRYRVRGVNRHGAGPWSDWVTVLVRHGLARTPEPGSDRAGVLDLHASLLRMCAARGDMFSILSLPSATTPEDAVGHVVELRDRLAPAGGPDSRRVPSPDADPLGLLSFGALYHPWIVTVADPAATGVRRGRESLPLGTTAADTPAAGGAPTATGAPRSHPPDGAICGVFAARARSRGAWVAAANVAIRDVVAIDHPVADGDLLAMHMIGINVVRRTPAGFLVLAGHTLSEDGVLAMANVRRLLALLHRLALLRGPDYVFEPNSPAFRRRVERGFEAILASLFERGAFAGDRASDAYRVSVGDPPNSPQSVDEGRLIVDLQVAPSLPLEFLTVRLVRSGDRFAVEVG